MLMWVYILSNPVSAYSNNYAVTESSSSNAVRGEPFCVWKSGTLQIIFYFTICEVVFCNLQRNCSTINFVEVILNFAISENTTDCGKTPPQIAE